MEGNNRNVVAKISHILILILARVRNSSFIIFSIQELLGKNSFISHFFPSHQFSTNDFSGDYDAPLNHQANSISPDDPLGEENLIALGSIFVSNNRFQRIIILSFTKDRKKIIIHIETKFSYFHPYLLIYKIYRLKKKISFAIRMLVRNVAGKNSQEFKLFREDEKLIYQSWENGL